MPQMLPHNARLKIGLSIIRLRNLNSPRLCTRNVIEATNGKFEGEIVLLPCISMIPSETTIPFKRIQFPIRLAFPMIINKSQGLSMCICGLDFENPCFSHGQLYVGCSSVSTPSDLFVLTKDELAKKIIYQTLLH